MLEKIIFNVLALALFTITFLKLIRKNDTSYIYVLALEFVGLAINFIELFFSIKLSIILKITEKNPFPGLSSSQGTDFLSFNSILFLLSLRSALPVPPPLHLQNSSSQIPVPSGIRSRPAYPSFPAITDGIHRHWKHR